MKSLKNRDNGSSLGVVSGSLYFKHLANFWRDVFLALILASLFMTPLSMKIFTFGGRYIPEPIYFLAILFGLTYVFRDVLRVNPFLMRFGVIYSSVSITLFVVGLLKFGDFVASYGAFRSVMILLLAIFYGAWFRIKSSYVSLLHSICIFSLVITFLCPYFIVSDEQEAVKNAIPIMAGLLAISLSLLWGDVVDVFVDLILIDVICLFSFYRGYMLAAAIITVVVLLVIIWRLCFLESDLKYKLKVAFFAFVLVFLVPYAYLYFNNVIELDESKYIQSAGKIMDLVKLFNGEAVLASSEQTRVDYYSYIGSNWSKHIIPGGFCSTTSLHGSLSTIMPVELPYGNSLDSFFVFLFFHVGSLSLIVVPFFLYFVLRRLINFLSYILGIGFFLVIFVYLNMAAEYLTVVIKAVPMGLFFGYFIFSVHRGNRYLFK